MKKKLIAVHLLNDYSGSPLVFSQALRALRQDYAITLYTATPSGKGFLSDISGIAYSPVFYRRTSNKWLTLFFFLLSQFMLFTTLVIKLNRGDIVYINTLLPFGAALATRVRGCSVIYHIHETSLKPALLKSFLCFVTSITAGQILFVSRYVAGQYHFARAKTTVIYNSLPECFTKAAGQIEPPNPKRPFTVTMLCSLKAYKGIHEFVEIARRLPHLTFELVLNAHEQEIDEFRKEAQPPANCLLFPAQGNTLPFYERAHIVLNLSRPSGWIETFGMTLLEAMHCGRPVICPLVGGVLELVTNGREGYTIDSSDKESISMTIERLFVDFDLYKGLSGAALKRSSDFSAHTFRQKLDGVFKSLSDSDKGKNRKAVSGKWKQGQLEINRNPL